MYEHEHRWGPLTLALVIAGGIVLGGFALSAAFWMLGLLAGVVTALLRIGLLVGLAAVAVWAVRFLFRGDRRCA